MYAHILIATDGSDLANRAVEQGLTLAKALGSKATAITVTEPWTAAVSGEWAVAFPVAEYEKAAAANAEKILEQVTDLLEVIPIVRSHHERLDGGGYPDGLKAEQIPLLVRILSVIDVWDALTSARAYRSAWPQEEALKYLRENSGTQFDSELVNTWIGVVQGNGKRTKAS